MSREQAEKKSLESLVKIVSWATCGVEPSLMGLGPIPSIQEALSKANWKIDEVDLFEINEAFAAQSVAVIKELKIPEQKVNVNGGAIALGHPIGASGARILVTLIHEMIKQDKKKGCAALCIGGGMGIAMCIERKPSEREWRGTWRSAPARPKWRWTRGGGMGIAMCIERS